MSWTRRNLLTSVKEKVANTSPMSDDFWQNCHNCLLEKFPSLAEDGSLIDGKTVKNWLDYFCDKTKSRWRGAANRNWKTLLGNTFFDISIVISSLALNVEPSMDDSMTDAPMEIEQSPPIDLKDLSCFQAFNCPRCDFKSNDRILFKTHVIENHDYVKGE